MNLEFPVHMVCSYFKGMTSSDGLCSLASINGKQWFRRLGAHRERVWKSIEVEREFSEPYFLENQTRRKKRIQHTAKFPFGINPTHTLLGVC